MSTYLTLHTTRTAYLTKQELKQLTIEGDSVGESIVFSIIYLQKKYIGI